MNYRIVKNGDDPMKIVINYGKKSPTGRGGSAIIRIKEEAHAALCSISRMTSVPIGKLAEMCISYCIENEKIVIIEEDKQ